MSGTALGLALGAALLHALWNTLLAGSRDSVTATGALLLFGALLLAPFALFAGDVSSDAIPFIAASAALELAYFAMLARAYRGGELGVIYPVSRGSAPVVVLAVAAALGLGEGVSWLAAAGVLLVAAGVLLVTRRPADARDLAFGLVIGVAIAGYTLVDSEGLAHADPVPYLFFVAAFCAVAYNGALVLGGRAQALRSELNGRMLGTAVATTGSYLMVLAALERAPAAPVAAVRESSIVIAALLAWVFLKEELRLAGAVLVAAGVAVIAYS